MLDEIIISIVRNADDYEVHTKHVIHNPNSGDDSPIDMTQKPPRRFDAQACLADLPKIRRAIQFAIQDRDRSDEQLRNYGQVLFAALFGDLAEQVLEGPKRSAAGKGVALRIRLDLPNELQSIPWELTLRTDHEPYDFICLDRSIELVRSQPKRITRNNPRTDFPLKILVVVSSPYDQAPINARAEIERLLDALDELIRDGKVQLQFIHGAQTESRLDDVLRKGSFHVLHFIGHGVLEQGRSYLVMEDSNRHQQRMDCESVFRLLSGPTSPHLVVLSACECAAASSEPSQGNSFSESFASIADGLVKTGVLAVVAYHFDISDRAATAITGALYDRIAKGSTIGEAISYVRNSMQMKNSLASVVERFMPVLFLNSRNGTVLTSDQGDGIPRQDCFALMRRAASSAEASKRYSEALDYLHTALKINPTDKESLEAERRLRAEENLDSNLHLAEYCERSGDWIGAWNALEQYELAVSNQSDEDCASRANELTQVRQRKAIIQSGLGACDPNFVWQE